MSHYQDGQFCGTLPTIMRTSVGGGYRGDDFLNILRLLALGLGVLSLVHLASTKRLQTWNALGVAVGVLGGLADL